MPLALAVLLLVLGMICVLALLGYLIDKSEDAHERNSGGGVDRPGVEQQ